MKLLHRADRALCVHRYASDQKVGSMLLSFLQVRQRDWSSYILLLFVLGLGYRFLAGAVLTVRVRNCKPV